MQGIRGVFSAFDRADRARADLIDATMVNINTQRAASKRLGDITHGLSAEDGIILAVRQLEKDLAPAKPSLKGDDG